MQATSRCGSSCGITLASPTERRRGQRQRLDPEHVLGVAGDDPEHAAAAVRRPRARASARSRLKTPVSWARLTAAASRASPLPVQRCTTESGRRPVCRERGHDRRVIVV